MCVWLLYRKEMSWTSGEHNKQLLVKYGHNHWCLFAVHFTVFLKSVPRPKPCVSIRSFSRLCPTPESSAHTYKLDRYLCLEVTYSKYSQVGWVVVVALDERINGSYPVRRLVLHVANRCSELCGSRQQTTWMDFSLLEIDCVMLAILGEFISLRQSSVMSSILLINQPVDPWLHSVCS